MEDAEQARPVVKYHLLTAGFDLYASHDQVVQTKLPVRSVLTLTVLTWLAMHLPVGHSLHWPALLTVVYYVFVVY